MGMVAASRSNESDGKWKREGAKIVKRTRRRETNRGDSEAAEKFAETLFISATCHGIAQRRRISVFSISAFTLDKPTANLTNLTNNEVS